MAYSAEIWAELRAAYESGKYKSIVQLHEEYHKKQQNNSKTMPSLKQLTIRATKEKWEKAKDEPAIIEAQHEKFLRIARELGYGEKEMMESVLSLCKDGDKAVVNQGLQRFYDVTGVKAPHKIARTDDTGNVIADTIFIIPKHEFGKYSR